MRLFRRWWSRFVFGWDSALAEHTERTSQTDLCPDEVEVPER